MSLAQIQMAPRSVDMVRIIRRSMRCFVFGLIGLVPILGVGLAVQALRLQRAVCAELGEPWQAPPVYFYLLFTALGLWWLDPRLGFGGDIFLVVAVLTAQSCHVFRRFPSPEKAVWNPGRAALIGGVMLAYAGQTITLSGVVIALCRIVKLSGPT